MLGMLSRTLLPLLAAWQAAAQDGPTPEAAATLGALGTDDECRAGIVERCGLNAVQLRRQRVSLSQGEDEQAVSDLDDTDMLEQDPEPAEAPAGPAAEKPDESTEPEPAKEDTQETEPAKPGTDDGGLPAEAPGADGPASPEAEPAEGETEATEPETPTPPEESKEPEPTTGGTKEAEPTKGDAGEAKPAEPAESDPESVEPKDEGVLQPWEQCGGMEYKGPTACVEGYACVNVTEYYAQCKPADKKRPWKKYNSSDLLDQKSEASVKTFYMYRAVDANDYPPTNANIGSIGALMWYLHNEVVSCMTCGLVRPYNIERIVRFKVQTKATQPLYLAGMNFGLTMAFKDGRCMGPDDCDEKFTNYGYFVGCNNLSSGFPYPDFPVYYKGVTYSLPAKCTALERKHKSMECNHGQPGGLCQGEPTGNGTCTWSYTEAGSVSLDELEGLANFSAFKEDGGQEYSLNLDAGLNLTFWDGGHDTKANAKRVAKLDALFKEKYPDMPSDTDLPPPACDFDKKKFESTAKAVKAGSSA